MIEVLRIVANVATPVALLGLVAALSYYAYVRRLKYQEIKLRSLSPVQRAKVADEYLTRYGIDGKTFDDEKKLFLLTDELKKRHQRAILYVVLGTAAFVICFGLAVFAPKPQTIDHNTVPGTLFQGAPAVDDLVRLRGATEESIVGIAARCDDMKLRELAEKYENDPVTLLRIVRERYLK